MLHLSAELSRFTSIRIVLNWTEEVDAGSYMIKLLIGDHAQQAKTEIQKICRNFQTSFEMKKEGNT